MKNDCEFVMKYKFVLPITGLFAAILLITNTLNTKMFAIGGIPFPAGIIVFPLSYLLGDILTEVYGYSTSRRIVWTGFASVLLMLVCYEIAIALPAASFWNNQAAFESIFQGAPRMVLASFTAYLCGEFMNSYVVAKMKVRTKGRYMSLRFVASTLIGEFVDTSVVIAIAFWGVLKAGDMVQLMFSAWVFKVTWEIIALPVTIPLVNKIKHIEQVDYFDSATDFNPFHIK